MRNIALCWLSLYALFIASAGGSAWAQDDPSCWASKRMTDLRTGKVRSECKPEPESWRNFTRLRQLAELGTAGQKDASYVMERLTDEDWDLRAEAARTLGLIGYAEAIPQLVAAISPQDWRLTLEAMTSLTRLKAPEADSILKNIAGTYWLPAVAETANNLAAKLPLSTTAMAVSIRVPVDYCDADPSRCPILRDHPSLKGAHQAPVILESHGGKLIGTNHGEWGGELGFIDERTLQTQETIIDDNVLAIVERGGRIVVVTGLNHGGLNRGDIWALTRAADGKWSARRQWRLPGTPYEIVAAPDGTMGLFGQFGSVLYKTDDTLQWLACGPSEKCRN